MAAPTFDLSGLVLLENTIVAMEATQAATPSVFTGGASFNVTYANAAQPGAPTTMTVAKLRDRIRRLHLACDSLPS
jgi:hypothetical protein